ncbi:MAG: hypothetical protein ACM3VS_12675 [Candidatus Dadabacteria bacterium]
MDLSNPIFRPFIVILLTLLPYCVFAQIRDTAKISLPAKGNGIIKSLIKNVTRTRIDSSMQADVLNSRNEEPFLPYQGKGIRTIIIRQLRFEKIFTDTLKEARYPGKNLIRHLHSDTKAWVIRNNLFIKEKTALNAATVADNERYLRSLEYIYDARILVDTIPGIPDSVDLIVMTKDFMSLTFALHEARQGLFNTTIGDANFLGRAQKLQFTALFDNKRNPAFGYEVLFKNNSIANTFINATIDYSKIKADLNDGTQDEQAWYAKLERPLVSQYLHLAGGLMVGKNQVFNSYSRPDTGFYKYHYNLFDTWVGYNLGIRKFLFLQSEKNRQFISLRYFRQNFIEVPSQVGERMNFRFNDKQAVLGQFTFFSQRFYKTNYVYGFGITEDIPYGYNIALTTGLYQQLLLKRAYIGIDANRYVVTTRGKLMQYFLRTGTFLHQGRLQDAAILIGSRAYSRILFYKSLKMRQFFGLTYTKQINRVGLDLLDINNAYGLRYFSLDSARGDQRLSFQAETFLFLKSKLLGFRFAPFAFGDVAILTPEHKDITKSGFYYGLGGGMRIRNENIVFGTIELRFIYFPNVSQYNSSFKFTLSTNIRFRYNSTYVKAPDIIELNSEENSTINGIRDR